MVFHLKPPSPMSSSPLAAVTLIAARNLEARGYIVIEYNLWGEHTKYVLTPKGEKTFDQGSSAMQVGV